MKKANKAKASAKNVKADNAKAESAKTVQAVVITNDLKANHSMRVTAASRGVDLFATHSEINTSKGYVLQIVGVNKQELYKEIKDNAVSLLIVNGVLNLVKVGKNGFYGRNGKLAVSNFTEEQMLVGNVDSLKTLYGSRVSLITEEGARKLFEAQKETVTRTVGSGKHKVKVTGRVIAQGMKGDMVLSVVAVEDGKKLVFHNCEDKNNTHNASHRFTQEKATASKS